MELETDDGPLDFELEDQFALRQPTAMKRNKVIGLDDLLLECKKDEEILKRSKSKGAKARKHSTQDDDEESAENKLSKAVDDVHQLIKEIDGQDNVSNGLEVKDEIPVWGIQVFGTQKAPSPVTCPALESSGLLQKFISSDLSLLVEFKLAEGENFLEGFLLNGWLSKFVLTCGCVEEFIAKWSFNLLLYSPEESLRAAACDFWCSILLNKEVHTFPVIIEWLPSYSQLKAALESFGFLLCSPASIPSDRVLDPDNKALPNVITWIKFVAACCQARSRYPMFSTHQAEELVGIIICFFLDRRLQGLSVSLNECVLSSICLFEEEEWSTSCGAVVKFLACRVPRDMNCLRILGCISGINSRSKMLRSRIAFEVLKTCLKEASNIKDILRAVVSINVKNRSCNLFDIYIYIALTENLLIMNDLRDKEIDEMWDLFLQKCSTQITNTDFRPFAQEVRNRASYLLQGVNVC